MTNNERPPGFFIYILDLIGDGKVEAMSTEEFGAYILLLFKAWFEDPPASIPNDDYVLSRWTRLTPERWSECKPRVISAFRLGTDDRYHQKRLRKEYEKMREQKRKKTEAAREAATTRWKDYRCKRNAKAMRKNAILLLLLFLIIKSPPIPPQRGMRFGNLRCG